MALLEAREVTVRFGGLVAVDGVSLEVDAGDLRGLIGPNGAGKSSFLAAVSGQRVPDGGHVVLDGVDVTDAAPERRSHLGMARTFQRLELFRNMTVLDNLRVAAEARFGESDFVADILGRVRKGEAEGLARGVLDRLGLTGVADRWAGEVPLGTGRLVEIGRALATRPRLLLLDEPRGGLDEAESSRLGDVLGALRDEGLAVLLVEHDIDLVMGLCDGIAVMDFGHLIAEGSPRAVRRDPSVRAAYLGREVRRAGAARSA